MKISEPERRPSNEDTLSDWPELRGEGGEDFTSMAFFLYRRNRGTGGESWGEGGRWTYRIDDSESEELWAGVA